MKARALVALGVVALMLAGTGVVLGAGEGFSGPAGSVSPVEATASGSVLGVSDNISVTKSVEPTVTYPSQPVTYTVVFTNSDASDDYLQTITDTMPSNLQFSDMSSGSEVTEDPQLLGGELVWTGPYTVPASGTLTLEYLVQVPWNSQYRDELPGTLNNQVIAVTTGGETAGPAFASLEVVFHRGLFPYVTKPNYLMSSNFDTGDYGWTDFLNYHRLNPEQWYWGSNFGYEGDPSGHGGLRHDQYRGGGIREAHDALTMYLAEDAHENDPQYWTDYRYTAKVKVIEGNQAGVWFRGTYIPNQPSGKYVGGYYFWISPHWGGVVQLQKLRNSGSTAGHFSDPEDIAEASYPIQASTWHTLKIEVQGDQIKCFVDNTQVLHVTDSTWSRGTVGFMGYRMEDARFDEVLVEPLG